jgi:NAD(P)-dependent dehydrogenase (short-subunit alcohol dehydrogenase family)
MADQVDPHAMTSATQFVKTMHRSIYPAIDPSNPANSAKGKHLLLTGASRGIGKAIALAWAKAGVSGTVLTGRSVKDLSAVAEEVKAISPSTEVLVEAADITSAESIDELWKKIKTKFGEVDVLINNAGTLNGGLNAFVPIGEIDPKNWWLDFVCTPT